MGRCVSYLSEQLGILREVSGIIYPFQCRRSFGRLRIAVSGSIRCLSPNFVFYGFSVGTVPTMDQLSKHLLP
jgi:hypothetical protein